MDEKSVRVIENVQEVLDLLKERGLRVEDRVRAEEVINKVDKKLDIARASLREHVDSHLGEIHVNIDGEIFRITPHGNVGNVIIEPVHIDFERINVKLTNS